MRRPLDPGIFLIALFELAKGTLVAISAVGLLTVIHKDLGDVLTQWIKRLRVDPDNYYVHIVITRLSGLTARQLEAISAGSLLYAVLRYVEGLGLMWRRRWAAYVTVPATAAFIPLEVFELTRRVSWPKLAIIMMNVAVVWYLIVRLRTERRRDRLDAPASCG
jgi:uncharacterized membrane protein (DUF2068 family)